MSPHFSPKLRGFTIIEMLVSIAILGVVVTIILFNQSKYTETAALTVLADNVAARLSEAQAYGIAVKERAPGSADFSGAYGVSLTLMESGSNLSYRFFIDRDLDGMYSGTVSCSTGGTSECLENVAMTYGNYLDSICIIKTSGNDDCGAPRRADVTFLRPATAARISVWNSGGHLLAPGNMAGVRYVFKSPGGLSRSVAIYYSGQVSVQTP